MQHLIEWLTQRQNCYLPGTLIEATLHCNFVSTEHLPPTEYSAHTHTHSHNRMQALNLNVTNACMHTHMTQSDKHTLSRFHLLKIVWIMSCIHEPNQCPSHTCWPVPLGCAFVCPATMTWHYNLHTKIVAHVKRNRYHFLIREGPAASSIEPHRYHITVEEQSLWPLEMKFKKKLK